MIEIKNSAWNIFCDDSHHPSNLNTAIVQLLIVHPIYICTETLESFWALSPAFFLQFISPLFISNIMEQVVIISHLTSGILVPAVLILIPHTHAS